MSRRLLTTTTLAVGALLLAGCGHSAADVPFTGGPAVAAASTPPASPAGGHTVTGPALETLLAQPTDFGTGWTERAVPTGDGPLRAQCGSVSVPAPAASAVAGFIASGGTVSETLTRYAGTPAAALAAMVAVGKNCPTVTVAGGTYTVIALPAVPGLPSAGLQLHSDGGDRVLYAGVVGNVLAVADSAVGGASPDELDAYGLAAFRVVVARAGGHTPAPVPASGTGGAAGSGLVPPAGTAGSGGSAWLDPNPGGYGGATVNPNGAGDRGPGNQVGPGGTGAP